MLLPTKGVSAQRALITVGSEILEELQGPMSVSSLWERFDGRQRSAPEAGRITFDWFSLALSTLYAMQVVEYSHDGYLRRTHVS